MQGHLRRLLAAENAQPATSNLNGVLVLPVNGQSERILRNCALWLGPRLLPIFANYGRIGLKFSRRLVECHIC